MKKLVLFLFFLGCFVVAQETWTFNTVEYTDTAQQIKTTGNITVYENKDMLFTLNNYSSYLRYVSHEESVYKNKRVVETLLIDKEYQYVIISFIEYLDAVLIETTEQKVWLLNQ